jgi:peptidoglycan hydrolase-like protein with peptidoglycan-binding domain
MGISKRELNGQLESARANGWDLICAGAEEEKGLSKGLLLAIASRETNMADVVGDSGHGRGLFQIDDRFWREWLTARGVAGRGKKPLIGDAARLAAAIVSDNLAFGRKNGVAAGDLLKFAASAYNAGPGGAIRGYREGDSDLHTTGNDYGKDVLERLEGLRGRDGGRDGERPRPARDGLLRVGSSGGRVALMKQRLENWFELNAPGEWETLAVEPGPFFGPKLERAVRVFQERRGLEVDGIVGPQTLGALGISAGTVAPPVLPTQGDLTLDRVYRRRSAGLYVRLIQGWLTLHGFSLGVDGEFGPATAQRVKEFQTAKGLPPTGVVDQAAYDELTAPMRASLAPLRRAPSLGAMVVAYAKQHLAQRPREVQAFPNDGPWVRLYMDGNEGEDWPWCAGFATFVLKQACATMGVPMPVRRTYLCDVMADDARAQGTFLANPGPAARKRITPGSFYVRRSTSGPLEYAHVGIVIDTDRDTVRSIEGNTTGDAGSAIVYAFERVQDYARKDFVLVR